MKNIYIILFSVFIIHAQNLFDNYTVHSLNIQFYNPNFNQILQNNWEIDDKSYELATLIFNGEYWHNGSQPTEDVRCVINTNIRI